MSDFSFLIDSAKKLKSIGADIITIADSPLARSRADSILSASIVKRSTDIDVLPHISCRDRNQIAIKGALLGAAYEHINKILVVTGDPIMSDVYSKRNGVYCFNSKELISYINSLNKDVFADCPFLIGGALNVNVKKFDLELKRRRGKAGDMSLIAMNNKGEWGCATNIEGFSFVVATEKQVPTVYLVNHDEDGKCTFEVASKEWMDNYMATRTAPLVRK